MYIKEKCYYLKPHIDPKMLQEKFGFDENYARQIDEYNWIKYYTDTNRFAIPYSFYYHEGAVRYVKKYIKDLIKADIVEIKSRWYWLALGKKYQYYSEEKRNKIEAEIDRRNKELRF